MKFAFTTHRFELGFTLDIQNIAKIQGSIDLFHTKRTYYVPSLYYLIGHVTLLLLGSAVSIKSEKAGFSTKFELSFMYLLFTMNNV